MSSKPSKNAADAETREHDASLALLDQVESNASALPHFASFATHRLELTRRVLTAAAGRQDLRLCVLGAGNCFDLDLQALATVYAAVHLVDIDQSALEAAVLRAPPEARARLHVHAPVELSGILTQLERWRALDITMDEALAYPQLASERISRQLPGAFDVVVSACLLTQLQRAVVDVLSDKHPLFEAARHTTTLIHLKTLLRLTAAAGHAMLVTDVTSDALWPALRSEARTDLTSLFSEVRRAGRLFNAVDPQLLTLICNDDPELARGFSVQAPDSPWLWHNGPEQVLLVYALGLART